MIKGLILLEDITILNAYAPNNREPKYMRQKPETTRRNNKSSN